LEIARLRSFLRAHRRFAIDSCIFIYQWDRNSRYSDLTDIVFSSLEQAQARAVTSTITMCELLVHPCSIHDRKQVAELFGWFSTYPNLDWLAPDLEISSLAAQIRAQHRLRTADALQAATAIHAQVTALITNDPVFSRVGRFETLLLDGLL